MWSGERDGRRFQTQPSTPERTEFERDRDRVLYSNAFHRLRGVTQVARSGESYPYHTRLTHSLKVAQVGRRLAQYINRRGDSENIDIKINPSVVATAAMAHDLGHPPFGHAAEEELDYQIKRRGVDDGFEGNPQSFRIVNRNEINALFRDEPGDEGRGLNLTRASLNAMIKYPWECGESVPDTNYNTEKKFGYYSEEKEVYEWVRGDMNNHQQTLEAKIMDWADDVTYAVHDVIDFYCAGILPLDQFFQDTTEREEFVQKFNEADYVEVSDRFDAIQYLNQLKQDGLDEPEMKKSYTRSRANEALLDRLKSKLIEEYLTVPSTVALVEDDKRPSGWDIEIAPMKKSQVKFLKELTFEYAIDNTAIKSQQHGQRRIIATLFDAFLASTDPGFDSEFGEYAEYEEKIIPLPFREDLKEARDRESRVRLISDAITSMTEQQAIDLYERITGHRPGSVQNQIF